jgi:hypothetical protein
MFGCLPIQGEDALLSACRKPNPEGLAALYVNLAYLLEEYLLTKEQQVRTVVT